MHTVLTRAHQRTRSTARDLRALMRDQRVAPATLAWILRCSYLRALRLRYFSTAWTVDELLALVDACSPAAQSVPVWGAFTAVTR